MRRWIGVVAVVTALGAGTAPVGADDPTVTIAPDTGIVDGQTLGYDTDLVATVYALHPCNDPADAFACVGDRIEVVPGPTGTVTARRWIGNSDEDRVVDCAWEQCWMHLDGFDISSPDITLLGRATTPVSFAPVDNLELRPGDGTTELWASFFGVEPGSAAFAMRCGFNAGFVCGGLGTVDTAFDGSFAGVVSAAPTFLAGERVVDCNLHPCGVAVVVLGPGPVVAGGLGARDPRN